MDRITQTVISQFEIRKTKQQKRAFREWLIPQLAQRGIKAEAVNEKGGAVNIVVGSPETAKVVYTAHYDTCPVMPFPNFITPKNFFVYIVYQFLIVGVIFAAAYVLSFGAMRLLGIDDRTLSMFAMLVIVYAFLFFMMFGPANRHTMNDNTSGVAALSELMLNMPAQQREQCAFVFFDLEEVGLVGSARLSKRYGAALKDTLIVNLDCVGDGKNVLLVRSKKLTADLRQCAAFDAAFTPNGEYSVLYERPSTAFYPSDQKSFKKSAAVATLNKSRVFGYYMDRIHTPRDTRLDSGNIDYIVSALLGFTSSI